MGERFSIDWRIGVLSTCVWWPLSVVVANSTTYLADVSRQDLSSSTTPLLTVNAASRIHCALYCELTPPCIRYSYNPWTLYSCTLFSTKCLDFDQPEQGRQYFTKKPKGSSDRCSSCPVTYYCDDSTPVTLCARYCFVTGELWQYKLRKRCKIDGGELIRIDSPSKQQAVENILRARTEEVWIQGKCERKSQRWTFEDGTPIPYSNWDTTPTIASYKRRVVIRKTLSGFKWFEKRHGKYDDIGALCEYPLQ